MTLEEFLTEWRSPAACISVQTSGSTGTPKQMQAEKRRMQASARITCQFLGLQAGQTALLCLPLDYIAGKMMVVRALTWGLRLLPVPPSSHPLAAPPAGSIDFAAMVPLQVWHSLQVAAERERLMQIRHLIIGGGAIDPSLSQQLKDFPNAVWSTYGMTETLSHIALRRLSGTEATDWYTPFGGIDLSQDADGCLVIDAPQLCAERLLTNDRAELRPDGRFRILGRRDNVVCSGGIKIQIEEAEERLRPFLAQPFCLSKRKDERLGEALVLLVEGHMAEGLDALCQRVLPRHWQPRAYVSVERLPLTATGKVARKQAEQLAAGAGARSPSAPYSS